MKKSIDQIELDKSGVFLVTASGKKQIAAPIRFKAIGHRTAHDPTSKRANSRAGGGSRS
jgi:hypothetical protein